MKRLIIAIFLLMLLTGLAFSQTGHIMQGAGAVNMSMGGAATAQPIDAAGALLWNPAAITALGSKTLSVSAGAFFSSPALTASLPADMMGPGSPAVKGTTKDDRGISAMPAIAFVFGDALSRHHFGFSAFGISGFGVTFPMEKNNPMSASFDPSKNSNPVNYPQQAGGFGRLQSDYMLMQLSISYAYELSDNLSIGIQPNFNYAALELIPNPLAAPGDGKGYPVSDQASALGYGVQAGIYYANDNGMKLGVSYKSPQTFGDFEFENTFLDDTKAPDNQFRMDYPSIVSVGFGYSKEKFDVALDVRQVLYESTAGFADQGWSSTASVKGFGWKDMTVVSFGVQYKGIQKLPVRLGYTYSTNPIDEELAFFSTPATAIIKHAAQLGIGFNVSDNLTLNGLFHYGTSAGSTKGKLLNPMMVSETNPYGEMPGTSVSYSMTTAMVMVGVNYTFKK